MDKVFSARVDEAVLDEMRRVAGKLGITKRQFLEEAIRLRVQQFSHREDVDIWAETSGAWRRRKESATAILRTARQQFQRSFERHHGRS